MDKLEGDIAGTIYIECEIVMAISDRIDFECDGREHDINSTHYRSYDITTRNLLKKWALEGCRYDWNR